MDLICQQYEALDVIKLEFEHFSISDAFYREMKKRKYADKLVLTTIL